MFRRLTVAFFLLLSLALLQGASPDTSVFCLETGEENCCVEIAGEMMCTQHCCEPSEEDCCLVLEEEAPEFIAPEKKPVPSPQLLAILPAHSPEFSLLTTPELVEDRFRSPDPPPESGRLLLALFERRLI